VRSHVTVMWFRFWSCIHLGSGERRTARQQRAEGKVSRPHVWADH